MMRLLRSHHRFILKYGIHNLNIHARRRRHRRRCSLSQAGLSIQKQNRCLLVFVCVTLTEKAKQS